MTDTPPAPGVDAATISHLAAPGASVDITEETLQFRQRCVWCGCLIVDVEIRNDGPEVNDDGDYGYEPGAMVRHDLDSGSWFPIEWDEDSDDVPGDSCMLLPLELTGSAGKAPSYR